MLDFVVGQRWSVICTVDEEIFVEATSLRQGCRGIAFGKFDRVICKRNAQNREFCWLWEKDFII